MTTNKKIKVFCFSVVLIVVLSLVVAIHTGSAKENNFETTTQIATTETTTAEATTQEITTETTTETTIETTTERPYRTMIVTATAYCPCSKCCGKSDGTTASGTKATAGRTIAVDPSVIPYGSEVEIDGHTYIAEDCGGAITNNKIDIFFATHEEALNFGKKQVEIKIYD